MNVKDYIQQILENVKKRNFYEPEFLQIVEEVLGFLGPVLEKHPVYYAKIINGDLLMIFA